jgi:cobalt transporter subunit CbtA
MTLFRNIVFAATLSGLIAGLLATVVHSFSTVPLILEAEIYETAAVHAQDGEAWAPANGVQRLASMALANLLTGIGFSLLLCSVFALRGCVMNWRRGMYWGLAGFAAFTVAPGLGLPPELPGIEAAPLLERQAWWLVTVAVTAGGLAMICLGSRKSFAIAGGALIVLPHIIGVPLPAEHVSLVPEHLVHDFIVTTFLVSLFFWLSLGMLSGWFYHRFAGNARGGFTMQSA